MVKDHSDSEKGNLHHPTDRITHTTAFVTPVVDSMGTIYDGYYIKNNQNNFYLMIAIKEEI